MKKKEKKKWLKPKIRTQVIEAMSLRLQVCMGVVGGGGDCDYWPIY